MDIIRNNWKLKLISLIIAIFLWSYVIALENPTITRQHRGLEVVVQEDEILADEGYAIVGQTPSTIDLEVVGKRNTLTDANIDNIYAYVELGDVSEGANSREIKYQIPRNITIEESSATYITFQIEKIISKEIDVSVEYTNEIDDEYIVSDVVSSPSQITVQGLRSQVDAIDSLSAVVDLAGVQTDQMVNVDIKALDSEGNEVKDVTLGQSFVNITMQVNKLKEVPIEVETVNETGEDLKINDITVEPNTVLILGKRDIVDKVDSIKTEAIDLEQIKTLNEKPISLRLPEGISLFNEEREFDLNVDMEELSTRSLDILIADIEFRNLEAGTQAVISNPTDKITLEIEGFISDIGDLTADDIEVFIDFTDLGIGSNRVTPQVDIGDVGVVKTITPSAVSVDITQDETET